MQRPFGSSAASCKGRQQGYAEALMTPLAFGCPLDTPCRSGACRLSLEQSEHLQATLSRRQGRRCGPCTRLSTRQACCGVCVSGCRQRQGPVWDQQLSPSYAGLAASRRAPNMAAQLSFEDMGCCFQAPDAASWTALSVMVLLCKGLQHGCWSATAWPTWWLRQLCMQRDPQGIYLHL